MGTNYAGKVTAALEALAEEDFVYLHVEAPDETSHEGSLEKKITAIEEFDRHIVGEVLKYQRTVPELRILVAPDHATPVTLKTHHAAPVPYALCGPGIAADGAQGYSEAAAQGRPAFTGPALFSGLSEDKFKGRDINRRRQNATHSAAHQVLRTTAKSITERTQQMLGMLF